MGTALGGSGLSFLISPPAHPSASVRPNPGCQKLEGKARGKLQDTRKAVGADFL